MRPDSAAGDRNRHSPTQLQWSLSHLSEPSLPKEPWRLGEWKTGCDRQRGKVSPQLACVLGTIPEKHRQGQRNIHP